MDGKNARKETIADEFQVRHAIDTVWHMDQFHYHDVFEIYLAFSDQAQYFIEDRVFATHHGDVFIFNNQEIHKTVPRSGLPYERYVLTFPPAMAEGLSSGRTDLLACFFNRPTGSSYPVHPSGQDWAALVSLFEEGIECCHDQNYGADVRKKLCLGAILLKINQICRQASAERQLSDSREYQRIQPVLQYIQQHLAGDLSLDTLGRTFYISTYHLGFLFRQVTGFSINEYIIRRKINLARELLASGLSVAEAAEQVGYSGTAHFIRLFKDRTGQTPKQYAKSRGS